MKSVKKMETSRRGTVAVKKSVPYTLTTLSPRRIEAMSEAELRQGLPQLVSFLQRGLLPKRPEWWPHSALPWTMPLLTTAVKTANLSSVRNLMKKCYYFLYQHSLRSSAGGKSLPAQPRVVDWLNSNPPSRTCTLPVKGTVVPGQGKRPGGKPYLDIYLCYQCSAEFSTKDSLQKHQVQCRGSMLELPMPSTPPVSDAPSPCASTTLPSDGSSLAPSSSSSPHPSSEISHPQFAAALDLVPLHRARKIRQARRRNTECETIDLEEPSTPLSPTTTPRTPKLLISQLSREAGGSSIGGFNQSDSSRRRLSYLRLSTEKKEGDGEEEAEDAGSEAGSVHSTTDSTEQPVIRKKTLLSIDVASALGQRVLKHMTAELFVPVISDLEEFCRTPIKDKDKYQSRLRTRQVYYPVTWKLTSKRQRQQDQCHLYKFTSAHRQDFRLKMMTGLTWQSRRLRDSLPRCRVMVKRLSRQTFYRWRPPVRGVNNLRQSLTREEVVRWTRPPPVLHRPSMFPKGPTFLLVDVDHVLGLKRKDSGVEAASKLLAGHCVSETTNAELQLQKLTVYRSLLTDLYMSVSGQDRHSPVSSQERLLHSSLSAVKHFTAGATQKRGTCGTPERAVCDKPENTASALQEETEDRDQNYPTLLSILSGAVPENQFPFQVRGSVGVSVDVQKPLKIDIPFSAVNLLPLKGEDKAVKNSLSVVTMSAEDRSDTGTSGKLCSDGDNCHCQPRDATTTTAQLSGCSVLAAPRTSHGCSMLAAPQASPGPPVLVLPSPAAGMSLSSQPTLSPPNLSPMSHHSHPCPPSPSPSPSPAATTKRQTRSSTVTSAVSQDSLGQSTVGQDAVVQNTGTRSNTLVSIVGQDTGSKSGQDTETGSSMVTSTESHSALGQDTKSSTEMSTAGQNKVGQDTGARGRSQVSTMGQDAESCSWSSEVTFKRLTRRDTLSAVPLSSPSWQGCCQSPGFASPMGFISTGKTTQSPDKASATSTRSSGRPSATQTPGRASATQSPARASATLSPGRASSTQSPGRASATQSPGRASATQSPSRASATQSPGRASATQSPGRASATLSPGRASATLFPGRASSTQSPGRASSTQSPGRASATQSPGRASATQSPGRASSTQSPGRASATQSPGRASSTQSPGRASATQSPGRASATLSPGRASATQSPGRASSTQSPGRASATLSPGRASTTLSPGRASATQSPGRASTTARQSPGRASSTQSPGRASTTSTQSSSKASTLSTQSPDRASASQSPGRTSTTLSSYKASATQSPGGVSSTDLEVCNPRQEKVMHSEGHRFTQSKRLFKRMPALTRSHTRARPRDSVCDDRDETSSRIRSCSGESEASTGQRNTPSSQGRTGHKTSVPTVTETPAHTQIREQGHGNVEGGETGAAEVLDGAACGEVDQYSRETVQHRVLKRKASDTTPAQSGSVNKRASEAMSTQPGGMKRRAFETVSAQSGSMKRKASETVYAQPGDLRRKGPETMSSLRGSLKRKPPEALSPELQRLHDSVGQVREKPTVSRGSYSSHKPLSPRQMMSVLESAKRSKRSQAWTLKTSSKADRTVNTSSLAKVREWPACTTSLCPSTHTNGGALPASAEAAQKASSGSTLRGSTHSAPTASSGSVLTSGVRQRAQKRPALELGIEARAQRDTSMSADAKGPLHTAVSVKSSRLASRSSGVSGQAGTKQKRSSVSGLAGTKKQANLRCATGPTKSGDASPKLARQNSAKGKKSTLLSSRVRSGIPQEQSVTRGWMQNSTAMTANRKGKQIKEGPAQRSDTRPAVSGRVSAGGVQQKNTARGSVGTSARTKLKASAKAKLKISVKAKLKTSAKKSGGRSRLKKAAKHSLESARFRGRGPKKQSLVTSGKGKGRQPGRHHLPRGGSSSNSRRKAKTKV